MGSLYIIFNIIMGREYLQSTLGKFNYFVTERIKLLQYFVKSYSIVEAIVRGSPAYSSYCLDRHGSDIELIYQF